MSKVTKSTKVYIELYCIFVLDETVPSIIVNVTNTERGHCEKMMSIFKYVNQITTSQIRWIVLADDDTLLRQV